MDGDENAGEVQHGGKDGLYSYLRIGDIHVLCHQERRCAHDGGHDLTTGRGGGLHRAGELRLVAGFLHHGDGDGASGHGVAHGGAGHHAAQGGGNDRHLGGAAAGPAGDTVGKADEEVGDAGALQKRAENDEQHDIGIAHVDGCADDAGGGIEQLIDDGLEGVIQRGAVHRTGVAELIDKGVDDQRARHAQNGHTHAAAAQLHQHQNADHADHDVHRLNTGGKAHQRHGIEGKIEEAGRANHHQYNIVPRQIVHLYMVLAGRIGQESNNHDAAHKQREPNLRHILGKQGHSDAEHAEHRHQYPDDELRRALPHTGGGFAVVFPHHRVQIRGLVGGGISACRRAGIRLFLVVAHSRFSPKYFRITRELRRETPPQPRKVSIPR